MSLFLLTTAMGDLLVGIVYNLLSFLSNTQLYYCFASLMILNFFLFLYVARSYQSPTATNNSDDPRDQISQNDTKTREQDNGTFSLLNHQDPEDSVLNLAGSGNSKSNNKNKDLENIGLLAMDPDHLESSALESHGHVAYS